MSYSTNDMRPRVLLPQPGPSSPSQSPGLWARLLPLLGSDIWTRRCLLPSTLRLRHVLRSWPLLRCGWYLPSQCACSPVSLAWLLGWSVESVCPEMFTTDNDPCPPDHAPTPRLWPQCVLMG